MCVIVRKFRTNLENIIIVGATNSILRGLKHSDKFLSILTLVQSEIQLDYKR